MVDLLQEHGSCSWLNSILRIPHSIYHRAMPLISSECFLACTPFLFLCPPTSTGQVEALPIPCLHNFSSFLFSFTFVLLQLFNQSSAQKQSGPYNVYVIISLLFLKHLNSPLTMGWSSSSLECHINIFMSWYSLPPHLISLHSQPHTLLSNIYTSRSSSTSCLHSPWSF